MMKEKFRWVAATAVIAALATLAACDPPGAGIIRPPRWIQGTWVVVVGGEVSDFFEWIFEENDIKYRAGNTTISFTEGYQGYRQWSQVVKTDTYELTGKQGGVTQTYRWKRTQTGLNYYVGDVIAYHLRRKE